MGTLYEYNNTGDNNEDAIYGDAWVAQTFTPSIAHTITSVKLKLWRYGSPGTLTVSIRATSGAEPTGADLVSGTTNGDTLPTTDASEWREISLGAGYALSASTKYAIVVRALSGDTNNEVYWRLDTTGAYGGGSSLNSGDGGSTWVDSDPGGSDMMFEDYGPTTFIPIVTIM